MFYINRYNYEIWIDSATILDLYSVSVGIFMFIRTIKLSDIWNESFEFHDFYVPSLYTFDCLRKHKKDKKFF